MKMKNSNRGAALVTVLVTTTFLTVLVTTLAYMSYMNYITKSMRQVSTDNFYTDEFALDDLTTELQQLSSGSPATSAIPDLVAAVSNAGDTAHWNGGKMASYIKLASQEANISVQAADGKSPDIVATSNTVTFKNVNIRSTTKKGGYVSNITSDITLAWPTVPKENFGVYDFSLITDAQMDIQKGNVTVGGCLYCRQPQDKDWAIRVRSGAVLSIIGPMALIHGKIQVDNGGILTIASKAYITGGIQIDEGGMMFNTSDTVEYAGVEPDSSRIKGKQPTLKYASDPAKRAEWVQAFDDLAGADGIGYSMVNEHLIIRNANGSIFDIYDRPGDLSSIAADDSFLFYNTQFNKESKPLKDGSKVKALVGLPTDTSNAINNSLVLSNQPMTIRGDCSNSTFICNNKTTLIFDIPGVPTFMQHMTEEGYEAAKNVLFVGHDYNINNNHPTYVSGYFDDYKTQAVVFADSGSMYGTEKIEYYKKSSSNDNIIPVGNLITPAAEANIAELLAIAGGGGVRPENSFVVYTNWHKDKKND
ncbi:MAG: hypothetical protein K6B44_00265 [Lachnospiraceae bacterium]|nr:hypothetical protein [Lachnospiraceae bacterium]